MTGRVRRPWATTAVVLVLLTRLAAQNNPASLDSVAQNAAAARDQGDIPGAIELYHRAVQLDPKWPDGWWFLGSLQYRTNAYAPARDALTHYIDLAGSPGPAVALRGLCEFETGEYDQALLDIQGGLSSGAANQPRNEQILRYHEAMLLTREGKFEDALQSYALLAKSKTADAELFLGAGLAGLRSPQLPKEVTSQQDLFLAAGSAALRFMAGGGAQQAFQELFQRFPTAANAHYLYGYLLFATDPGQGVAEFKRELEITPANAAANAMLAWALLLQGDPAHALPYAQKSATGQPTLAIAQLVLGRALVETERVAEGSEHLETALQLEPANLEVHLALAKAYAKSGRNEDARHERLLCLQIARNEATDVAHP